MKKILKRSLAVVLALVLVVASLLTGVSLKIKASEDFTGSRFYTLYAADFVLCNGNSTGFERDIVFYRDTNVVSGNSMTYNANTHTHEWFTRLRPAYCLNANAAFPHGVNYEVVDYLSNGNIYTRIHSDGTVSSRQMTEAERKGLANLLKNSSYTEYWYEKGVTNYGAQVQATQIAVWVCLGQYSRNTTWTGNTSKYGSAVSGVQQMIKDLVYYYDNPNERIPDPTVLVTKPSDNATISGNGQWFDYFIESTNCVNDINVKFSYTKNGVTYAGLPANSVAYFCNEGSNGAYEDIFKTSSDAGTTYHKYSGKIKVAIHVPFTVENRGIEIKLAASEPQRSFETDEIYYYETSSSTTKVTGSSEVYRRQNIMGYTKTVLEGYNNEKIVRASSPKGRLEVVKKDDLGNAISGIKFFVYSDSAMTNLVETLVTDGNGVAAFSGDFGGAYYLVEATDNSSAYTNTVKIEGISTEFSRGQAIEVKFLDTAKVSIAGNEYDLTYVSSANPAYYTASKNVVNFKKKYAIVKVHKTDERTSVNLSGVQFKLFTDLACTTEVPNSLVTTDANGVAVFPEVEYPGTYYMKEVSTSGQYVADNSVKEVVLSDATTTYNAATDRYLATVEKTNTPKDIKIGLNKKGEVLKSFTNGKFILKSV